jgi:hypothetical protein
MWEHSATMGNLAEVATACLGGVALLFAYLQIEASDRSQRYATAADIYRDYLRVAFENPKLASPCIDDRRIIKSFKYRWFVAIVLNACDEILEATKNDDEWIKVVLAEMEYHQTYLTSKYFSSSLEDHGWKLYSTRLRELFKANFEVGQRRRAQIVR